MSVPASETVFAFYAFKSASIDDECAYIIGDTSERCDLNYPGDRA